MMSDLMAEISERTFQQVTAVNIYQDGHSLGFKRELGNPLNFYCWGN